jgi:type II secretory pathway component PulK
VELAAQARALALSGIALGLDNNLTKDDPVLSQKTADGRFDVTFGSEGARLNLNYVLLNNHREILVNLFLTWGLKIDQADHVADCLYDWVTPGDLKSLNGAKANDYATAGLPQRPSHQAFVTFDEISLVMGMDLVEKAQPHWRDSFTLWSNGPLNVNEAPSELIAAVFSLDPDRVKFLTDARNGRDGLAGTSDDVPFKDLSTFQNELGVSDLVFKKLSGQVSLAEPTRRVESVGQAGGVQAIISVVTRLGTSPVQYLLWSER